MKLLVTEFAKTAEAMMTAKNDITGDALQSKTTNDAYREGWDRIFGKKKKSRPPKKMSQAEHEEQARKNSEAIQSTSLK